MPAVLTALPGQSFVPAPEARMSLLGTAELFFACQLFTQQRDALAAAVMAGMIFCELDVNGVFMQRLFSSSSCSVYGTVV